MRIELRKKNTDFLDNLLDSPSVVIKCRRNFFGYGFITTIEATPEMSETAKEIISAMTEASYERGASFPLSIPLSGTLNCIPDGYTASVKADEDEAIDAGLEEFLE